MRCSQRFAQPSRERSSVTDSVINSTPIAAEDEATKRVVISAAFFLTDIENVGRDIGAHTATLSLFGGPAAPRYAVDATKSYVERTKAFPKNVELLANLAFSGPPGDVGGAPDGRGVRLRMHYSIVDAPVADGYVPRLADDRVGYFITAQKRFDDDTLATPFVRYIDRWNFKNGPIVYYLTNEIPTQYKPAIRSALLDWNAAFAKVGIPNAIEVRDQPDDPTWDPDDVRYSSVRWITGAPFAAYGPHVEDPRTGEILRVEIVIDGEALRSVKRGFVDQVAPVRAIARDRSGLPLAATTLACPDTSACDTFAADSAEFAATGSVALRALGASPNAVERYAEDWLHSVVLHESGHNFGLRHNFVSATLYSLAQIHDRAFGRAHGIVGSVMGYTPTNISAPGTPQGEYFQLRLGPYDEWAIRYGYATFPNVRRPADEAVALRLRDGRRRERSARGRSARRDVRSLERSARVRPQSIRGRERSRRATRSDLSARRPTVLRRATDLHHDAANVRARGDARDEVRRRHVHLARSSARRVSANVAALAAICACAAASAPKRRMFEPKSSVYSMAPWYCGDVPDWGCEISDVARLARGPLRTVVRAVTALRTASAAWLVDIWADR